MPKPPRALPALLPVLPVLPLLVMLGCGGNGGGGAAPVVDGQSVRAAVSSSSAGSQCANGGLRIDSGLDSNGSGQLDSAEITLTQYVCNGAPGSSGIDALVRTSVEAPGTACPQGGVRVAVGADANANAVLDAGEETASAAICNGAAGATGTTGATGLSNLMAITTEPAGANCAHGGSKIQSGLDANRNSVLDAGEVSSTQYVCNGAPGPGITWETVTATSAQMQSGRGYIPSHATQAVQLTLPASPAVGDIVQVSGMGVGGWRVVQNAGQRINLTGLKGGWAGTWAGLVAAGAGSTAVASSADGCRIVVSVNSFVLSSSDCGLTSTPVDTTQPVYDLVSSGNGGVLLATYGDPAAVGAGNYGVLLSVNGGASWTAPFAASAYGSGGFYRLGAVSRSGTHLVMAEGTTLRRSSDSGTNWSATAAPANTWRSLAISDNGQKIAAVAHNSTVWISEDGGANWTSRASSLAWRQIVMSPDGSKLAAVADGAAMQLSVDGGVNWAATGAARSFTAVAMSDDGHYLLGGTAGDWLYVSRDGGQNWRTPVTAAVATSTVRTLALSADGRSLLAGGSLGALQSLSDTRPGALGYLLASSDEAVTLQYVGDGRFNLLDWTGLFLAR